MAHQRKCSQVPPRGGHNTSVPSPGFPSFGVWTFSGKPGGWRKRIAWPVRHLGPNPDLALSGCFWAVSSYVQCCLAMCYENEDKNVREEMNYVSRVCK